MMHGPKNSCGLAELIYTVEVEHSQILLFSLRPLKKKKKSAPDLLVRGRISLRLNVFFSYYSSKGYQKNTCIEGCRNIKTSQNNLSYLHPASDHPLLSSCCTGCASVHDAPDCGEAGWSPLHHACRSYSHSWGGGGGGERGGGKNKTRQQERQSREEMKDMS